MYNVKKIPVILLLVISSAGVITSCQKVSQNTLNESVTQPAMDHHNMMMGNDSMNLGVADAEYDLRFIDAMIPHHEGAIAMAKDALTKSSRKEMKNLAQAIITAQKKEIAEMKKWRSSWYPKAPQTPMAWSSQMNHSMPMSSEQMNAMMMTMDLGKADKDFDLRFIDAMIPHHEGAITMAEDALSKSKRPEIQKLAKNIISSQETEIKQLEQWRKNWY